MKYTAAVFAFTLSACSMAGMQRHAEDYQKRPTLRGMLRDATGSLTEEGIRKLLDSRVQLPDKAKLAVFPLSHEGVQVFDLRSVTDGAPVGFLQSRRAFLDAVEQPLLKTGRFTEITHVPDLLLPPTLTLAKLREAAALMQADLLLVYATRAQLLTYYGNLFTKDAVKAFVSVELLLLDVRTGVVPYAETFEDIHEIKKSGDWDMPDLQRRAEQEGLLKVLQGAGARMTHFFRP